MSQPFFLYVENDELSREVMHALLTRGLGYNTLKFLETSQRFEEELGQLDPKPDVIFLDIHMEPIDGFEMLEMIHRNPAYESTPVIALTASVMNEEVRKLREVGFDGVIAKPLDYDTFPRILARILEGEQVWKTK
ncbi:response regulator [Phototrophicus methaneseepsis]|uniref:Response regulator n=1 Tax=Phototrophicus methaneseepsis TaxID=2710758 RepID=A0A7S8EBD9_9CHLR|nr:response regulator [Phototrophicus methaneseepsis]QPC83857.1 response regulator [Phototrophicus methaneseepsis]